MLCLRLNALVKLYPSSGRQFYWVLCANTGCLRYSEIKTWRRFTSAPLCNYSSLAGSDLIYQGRSTCRSIPSHVMLKNSHQLNFTVEKRYRSSSNYCHLLIYTNREYAKQVQERSVGCLSVFMCFSISTVWLMFILRRAARRNLCAHLNSRGGLPL